MLSRHLYLMIYFIVIAFFISCNSSTDTNKPSTKTKQQLNQSQNDKIIKDLINKYNAIHLNSYFDEASDLLDGLGDGLGIDLFTYEVQKVLNNNKDEVFLIEGTIYDIIMEDTSYNFYLSGIFLLRDFSLIASLNEYQFNLIHNKIELNTYSNYAVIVKIKSINTTFALLRVYSDLLEIKQLH